MKNEVLYICKETKDLFERQFAEICDRKIPELKKELEEVRNNSLYDYKIPFLITELNKMDKEAVKINEIIRYSKFLTSKDVDKYIVGPLAEVEIKFNDGRTINFNIADIASSRYYSLDLPIVKSILGKMVGETVNFNVGSHVNELRITRINYYDSLINE
ncbi:MAG: GreA/GreB family elongation factor [Bacteroidales bacterium]|nr:GreA/GreB family elongation factor [Bacteroidales bacterium]